MRWIILFRTLLTTTYLDSWHIQILSIFKNSRHSRYRESLKYSSYGTLCKPEVFATLVYSSPNILRTRATWWAVFYRILCNTGIFRTRGIFRTQSNIFYGEFYSEPCVTLAYSVSKAYSGYCQTSIMKYFVQNLV